MPAATYTSVALVSCMLPERIACMTLSTPTWRRETLVRFVTCGQSISRIGKRLLHYEIMLSSFCAVTLFSSLDFEHNQLRTKPQYRCHLRFASRRMAPNEDFISTEVLYVARDPKHHEEKPYAIAYDAGGVIPQTNMTNESFPIEVQNFRPL